MSLIMSIERVVKHRQGLTKEEEVKRPLVLFWRGFYDFE